MSNTIKSDKSNIENIAKKINKIEVVARRAEKSADAASKEIISKISLIEVGHTSAPNTSLTLNYTGKEIYDLFNDGNSLFVKVGNDVAKVISIITDGKGADYEMFYQYGNKVYSCYLNKNENVAFINKIQAPTEPDPSTPEINVNPEYFCDFSDYMGNKSEINFNPYTGLYNSKAEDRNPKGLTPLLYRSDIGDYAGIYLKDMSFASNALNLLNVFNWGKGVKKTYRVTTKFNKEIDGMSSNKARTITASKQVTIYDPWNKKSWYYCPCCGKRAKDQNKWKLVNPVATGGADEDNAFGGDVEAEFEYVGNPTKESNKDYHEDNTLNSVFILIYYFFLKLREIMNKNTISLKDQIFKLFKLINGAKEDANKVTSITSKENGWDDNSFEFKSKVNNGTFGLDDLFGWIFALFGFQSKFLEKIIERSKNTSDNGWIALKNALGFGNYNGGSLFLKFFKDLFGLSFNFNFILNLSKLDADKDGRVSITEFFSGIFGVSVGENFAEVLGKFTDDFTSTINNLQIAISRGLTGFKELFNITLSGNIFKRIVDFFGDGLNISIPNADANLTMGGAWQNLMSIFGLNKFSAENLTYGNKVKETFEAIFGTLDNSEIIDVLNKVFKINSWANILVELDGQLDAAQQTVQNLNKAIANKIRDLFSTFFDGNGNRLTLVDSITIMWQKSIKGAPAVIKVLEFLKEIGGPDPDGNGNHRWTLNYIREFFAAFDSDNYTFTVGDKRDAKNREVYTYQRKSGGYGLSTFSTVQFLSSLAQDTNTLLGRIINGIKSITSTGWDGFLDLLKSGIGISNNDIKFKTFLNRIFNVEGFKNKGLFTSWNDVKDFFKDLFGED